MVPTKPFKDPMIISELVGDPTFEVAGDGAVMVKSLKLNVAVVEWDRELVVPVMVRA
jgi:hypothetical protein